MLKDASLLQTCARHALKWTRAASATGFVEEVIKLSGMGVALPIAARFLPWSGALLIADFFGLCSCLFSGRGWETYRSIRNNYEKGRLWSARITKRYLTLEFRDFVIIKRQIEGRESWDRFKIVEKHAEGVTSLRNSGKSYIVACGHFARQAVRALYLPNISPGHVVHVTAPSETGQRTLRGLRTRIQLSTLLSSITNMRPDAEFVIVDSQGLAGRQILRRLKQPGNVVFINVDAPWPEAISGCVTRPFGGFASRPFATGAARLSRLSQSPIVSCICSIEADGRTISLDWGEPIMTRNQGDQGDVSVTNILLDRIEEAIGKRPDQYVLRIGGSRVWNADGERWQDRKEKVKGK